MGTDESAALPTRLGGALLWALLAQGCAESTAMPSRSSFGVVDTPDGGHRGPCAAGAIEDCATECGTHGHRSCGSDGTWLGCLPRQESCNGVDDDCDGLIDQDVTRSGSPWSSQPGWIKPSAV